MIVDMEECFQKIIEKRNLLKAEPMIDRKSGFVYFLRYNICHNTPIYAKKQFFKRVHKA